jgi:phytoene dehydrogenase-like protein
MPYAMNAGSDYDAIVIGSGIGGLGAASTLATVARKRVLVLERHFRLGGFTQTFSRGGFSWDIGLHYVGDVDPSLLDRRVFDLATNGEVEWLPLPDRFDRFEYPGLSFAHPSDPERFARELGELFPAERRAIRRYVRDVFRARGWLRRHIAGTMRSGAFAAILEWPWRWPALRRAARTMRG